MLILSRKVGERITISGGIEIVIAAINGNRIKLAIEAPKNVHVLRAELPSQQRAASSGAIFPSELVEA